MNNAFIGYDEQGKPLNIWINTNNTEPPLWQELPFEPRTKTFDESNPLTTKLRAWESSNKPLDLSDRPPTPPPPAPPDWGKFRGSLLSDISYNRMRVTTLGTPAEIAGTRLENAAMASSEDWELIASQWSILLGYTMLEKKPTADEITRWNQLAREANMPFTFAATGAIALPDGRTISAIEADPAITQMAQNIDAYIAGTRSQVIQEKTALKVDGLHPDSFSEFSWTIWDTAESKIRPIKAGGKYLVRVTFLANCSEPSVIQLGLESGSIVIPSEPMQPFAAGVTNNATTINFFIRESFLATGLKLNISASAPTQINNAALYIVRLAG